MEESPTLDQLQKVKKKAELKNLPTGIVVTAGTVLKFDARAVGSSYVAETTRIVGLKLEKNWKVDQSSGLKKFGNVNKGEFSDDQAAANRVNVERARAGTQAFDDLLNTSNKVKWVFTVDNELWAVKAKQVVRQDGRKWGQWKEEERFWKEKFEKGDKGVKKTQEITHAVAANNKRCYAAGMAYWYQYKDKDNNNKRVLVINEHTGHYKASPESLQLVGVPAWKAAGVQVVTKERQDWKT